MSAIAPPAWRRMGCPSQRGTTWKCRWNTVWQAGPPDSTADQVKAAMSDAAARAKEMASSAAQAAGVVLGPVESVVAQPPAVCGYGQSGPQRVVQVTVTYSLK